MQVGQNSVCWRVRTKVALSLRVNYTVLNLLGDVMINVEVKRSPARVSWWVVVNGAFLQAFDRKWEANSYADDLRKRYV